MTVLLTSADKHIRLIQLNNPPANALGRAQRAAMLECLARIDADPQARAVVITGSGGSFCAGDDLKEARARNPGDMSDFEAFDAVYDTVEGFRVPVIAAINGHSFGGGFELALCCDIRLAASTATFACSAVNIGLLASAWRLPRLIGESAAKAMLLTGSTFGADHAARINLVHSVHPADGLISEALNIARRIASRAPLSVEAAKHLSGQSLGVSANEARSLNAALLERLAHSQDHQEALAAFLEKRAPVFHRA